MKNRNILLLTIAISSISLMGLTLQNQRVQDTDSLDLRTIMRLIMMDVHTINEGLYTHNYDLVESGAAAINTHPQLSDKKREEIRDVLGENMPAFGKYDKIVHDYADSIRVAAVNRDMDQILDHYSVMQQGCVNCHMSFQDEIRKARLSED